MSARRLLVGLSLSALVLAGCTPKATEPYRDAPVARRDSSAAEVYTMPDGFSNFAGKCDGHGHRVFVAFKGDDNRAAITAIDDPSCGR